MLTLLSVTALPTATSRRPDTGTAIPHSDNGLLRILPATAPVELKLSASAQNRPDYVCLTHRESFLGC
jgi:hypothetical protein